MSTGSPSQKIWLKKRNKRQLNHKINKMFLFADMILNTENSKYLIKKLFGVTNEFCKGGGYKTKCIYIH